MEAWAEGSQALFTVPGLRQFSRVYTCPDTALWWLTHVNSRTAWPDLPSQHYPPMTHPSAWTELAPRTEFCILSKKPFDFWRGWRIYLGDSSGLSPVKQRGVEDLQITTLGPKSFSWPLHASQLLTPHPEHWTSGQQEQTQGTRRLWPTGTDRIGIVSENHFLAHLPGPHQCLLCGERGAV